jgi:hypothetical protein
MVFMVSFIGIRKLTMRLMHAGLQIVWLGDVMVEVWSVAVSERVRGEAVGADIWEAELIRVHSCVLQC